MRNAERLDTLNPARMTVTSSGAVREAERPSSSKETLSSILQKIDLALDDMAEEKRKIRRLYLQLGISR